MMSVIEEIQERLDKEYVGYDRDDIMEDVSSVLTLFAAKNRAIELRLKEMEDIITFINNSVFKGSMSANKELHRLRGIKKELKSLCM